MKICQFILKLSICIIVCYFLSCSQPHTHPQVMLSTELGDIVIEVYLNKTPVTAANFLRYVDENRYREAQFYRVVTMDNQPNSDTKIEVIQGGIGFIESELRLAPIEHETTDKTGIIHTNGVVSMARAEPGTASSEFFICIGDQPELDYDGKRNPDGQGFAAFGRVIQGMDVVRKIHEQPAQEQMLVSPIRITIFRRVR
jgi:peptidyl-prolyl cis-trans isomerase A (cyclophilin A)